MSVCRGPAGLASQVRSCSLKPELKRDVVIPAGETALALSGALSQRAAGVTAGPSAFIAPLQLCGTAPTSTALFTRLQMWGSSKAPVFQGVFWMNVSNVLCCQ